MQSRKENRPSLMRTVWDNLTAPTRRTGNNPWTGGRTYRHLVYASSSAAQWLNLYVPYASAPAPLLVLVHGGGFVMNDAESHQAQLFYRYFRDHGYACATVNYRLAGEATFPAAMEDVKAALRFLGQQGKTYGYDPGRAALWGESAGAYLAVMAAYTGAGEYTGQPCVGEKDPARFPPLPLRALVDFYGPGDVTAQPAQFAAAGVPEWLGRISNGWLTRHTGAFASAEECWMGKPFAAWTPEDFDAFVPCRRVAASTCPHPGLRVLLLHGAADLTVAPAQSVQLCRVLQKTYGPEAARLQMVPHCKHADDRLYAPAVLEGVAAFLQECLDNTRP